MKTYNISGIVNVAMYQHILDPGVTLCDDKTDYEKVFNIKRYREIVKERAVVELKKLLATLPEEWHCEYVEGSAEIHSDYMRNILDRLYFKVTHSDKSKNGWDISEATLQDYLTSFFRKDWDAEFGASYRIYEYISSNYTEEEFYDEEVSA
jgi:hypothetical protein